MNLIERAQQYADGIVTLKEWLGSGAVTVGQHDAQTRANVCLRPDGDNPNCRLHIQSFNPATPVALAIKKQVELKNNLDLRVVGEKSLHTCNGCQCPLRLKIWLPIGSLGLDIDELQKYPEHCWMRTELI